MVYAQLIPGTLLCSFMNCYSTPGYPDKILLVPDTANRHAGALTITAVFVLTLSVDKRVTAIFVPILPVEKAITDVFVLTLPVDNPVPKISYC